MRYFVWVYGPTAVGKETLIRAIIRDHSHPLVKYLQIQQPIAIYPDALVLRHEQRQGIEKKIARYTNEATTLLIKAQGYDISNKLPIKLRRLLPQDKHIVIYLDANATILHNRRLQRGHPIEQWDDYHDREENLELVLELEQAGMNVIWIDSNGQQPTISQKPAI